MSDTILSGDFTVFYLSDNSRKQIKWTGAGTNTYSVNQLYSALQDLFDELAQLDDGIPMSAQTPTEYTIGAIDASDTVPWFIDDETIQHLKGGALQTKLWTRITGTQPGIIKVRCSANTSIVYGDIGQSISNAGGSTGTLLDLQGSGANTILYIRPTDASATHDWSATNSAITCNGHTATSAAAQPNFTGEALWANIYSLGSISTDKGNNPISDLYVYKNGAKVQALSSGASAYQWWSTGHIDILMKVKEPGAVIFQADAAIAGNVNVTLTTGNTTKLRVGQPILGANVPAGTTIAAITGLKTFTLSQNGTNGSALTLYANTIDGSYVTVFAREYDTTYDYFTVDLVSGGRNPIPLATGDDLNNHTGIRELTASAGTGTFQVGEIIYVGASLAAATKKGVVTGVSGSGNTSVIDYYLIGNLTDFSGGAETVKGAVSAAQITNGTVANNGAAANPATLSPAPAINFAISGYSLDLNNGNGSKPYSVQVDAKNTHSLAKMYEWTKYVTRRGSVDTANNNGINGEAYIGIDGKISYTTLTGSQFASGATIFQAATGASAIVVTHDTTNKIVLVRNTRGSFGTGAVTDGTNSLDSGAAGSTITPIKPNPYGSFAGGKFFAAPGVYFVNYLGTDAQAFQLTANDGSVQTPPNVVTVTITGLVAGDGAGVFRTNAGAIVKDTYSFSGAHTAGATSVVVSNGSQTAVRGDEPSAGYLRAVKVNGGGTGINQEHRYRYSALNTTSKTFTLTTVTAGQGGALTATAATQGADRLVRVTLGTAINTSQVFVGDMVYVAASGTPTTPLDYGTIVAIDDTTHIKVRTNSGNATNWSGTGNIVRFNQLVTSYANGTDKVFVPIIDAQAAGGQLSNTLIYSTDISALVRVRQYKNIIPFEQSTTIGSTGLTVSAIRAADTIAS